jgi:hypothetical protein
VTVSLTVSLAIPVQADVDSGDIAVVETDATILQPGKEFDLTGHTVIFTPKSGGGYTISLFSGTIDTRLGTNLALGDDVSSSAQTLGFTFPFFGVSYSSVFVNSNGYATFGSSSSFVTFNSPSATDLSTVLDRMAEGLPRIAPLWNDLNPLAGGGVFFNALSDRALITWNEVPRFGTSTPNTFQIALFPSGAIHFTYGSIGPASTNAIFGGFLVGISPSNANQFFVTTLDFFTGSGGSSSNFPNQEPLVQVFGGMSSPLIHVPAVARRFLTNHTDTIDQLVIIANFDNAMGSAFAFEISSRISMGGTGQSQTNLSSFFGSSGRLHSVLHMNKLSVYPDVLSCLADPQCRLSGNNDSTLTLMGQESGHQWLAFLHFNDGGASSDLLLGRASSHWSFFHHTQASNMEGNGWADNGDGTFTTNELTIRYSPLDQYAMGLRSASEVPNFFFISNPTGTTQTRSSTPALGVTASGTRQDVSISQVTAIEGTRASGFTGVNTTTVWHQAFILLVKAGTSPPAADLNKIETIRSNWVSYFSTAVGGRGSISTALGATTSQVWSEVPGGGKTNHSPAAVMEGSTLHLFVRGTDGALYLNSRSGGSFSGWSAVPGGGKSSSQPAVLLDGSSVLRLYVQGADNGLWVNTKSGSTWSGWSAVPGGGKSSSGPAVVLDGSSVRLVVRGLDDGIWTALADNPQWTSLGGKTNHSPAAVMEGSTLHLFVRGTDGALYLNSRSGGSFSGWSAVPGGGKSSSQPAVLLDGSSVLRLYVQGADNGLWVNTKSGSTWSGWSAVPGGGKSSSGPAVVLDGSSVRLVVRGLDDGIWTGTP